jgi:urease accessory protein
LWAAEMRRLALWILPLAFPFFMVSGAIAACYLGQVPIVEAGVAGSVFLLGLAIASAWRAPKPIAVLCITSFGILHGYAHGTESPGGIEGISYATGFVMCTAMLHCAGIALGFMLRSARLAICLRTGGAAIAAIGLWLLASAGVVA